MLGALTNRGPAATLFTSRNTCNLQRQYRKILFALVFFCVCVGRGIAQLSRGALQNGVSHRCAFVKLSTKGGVLQKIGGTANLPYTVSRHVRVIWGLTISRRNSRDMGPLSRRNPKNL